MAINKQLNYEKHFDRNLNRNKGFINDLLTFINALCDPYCKTESMYP